MALPSVELACASPDKPVGLRTCVHNPKSAALEAAPYGVRVNAVTPGPGQTAMLDRVTGGDAEAKASLLATIPQGRAGEPKEIAYAIVFIASDQAGFLTGQTIAIDCGVTAS